MKVHLVMIRINQVNRSLWRSRWPPEKRPRGRSRGPSCCRRARRRCWARRGYARP